MPEVQMPSPYDDSNRRHPLEGLPTDHKHYTKIAAQAEGLDPVAAQTMVMLAKQIDPAKVDDEDAVKQVLIGGAAQNNLAVAYEYGTRYATFGARDVAPAVPAAVDAIGVAAQEVAVLDRLVAQQVEFDDELVDLDGRQVPRSEALAWKPSIDQITVDRDAVEDTGWRDTPPAWWKTAIVAILTGVLEGYVLARLFNVDVTQIEMSSFLPWAAVVLIVVISQHICVRWLGGINRKYREMPRQSTEFANQSMNQFHSRGGAR